MDGYMDFIGSDSYGDMQDDRSKTLDITFIIMKQLDAIMRISSREFHTGIKLYREAGLLSGYIPDVLKSYISAINNLADLLSVYDFKPSKKIDMNDRDKAYEMAREQLRLCIKKIKDLGILPQQKMVIDVVKVRKSARKTELFNGVDQEAY